MTFSSKITLKWIDLTMNILNRCKKIFISEAKLSFNAYLINKSSNKCRTAWSPIRRAYQSNTTVNPNIKPTACNDHSGRSVKDTAASKIIRPSVEALNMLNNFLSFKSCDGFRYNLLLGSKKNYKSRDFNDISNNLVKEVPGSSAEPLSFSVNRQSFKMFIHFCTWLYNE